MSTIDLQRIFHPTDFSEASHRAFAHALRLAIGAKSILTIYHTEPHQPASSWKSFPHVRELLEGWGMIPPHSSRDAVTDLGIGVEKVSAGHRNARNSILKFLERHPHDLIVLATNQQVGLDRYLSRSVAEPIARRSGESTLFIPSRTPGFVSSETGAVRLRNILIPLDLAPYPELAIEVAVSLVEILGGQGETYHLLRTAPSRSRAPFEVIEKTGIRHNLLAGEGDPFAAVLATAAKVEADLIVTGSCRHEGLIETLRGSLTERIVRYANCPILTVPTDLLMNSSLQEVLIYQTE
ncbi:MAG: hypothetical protein RIR86_2591 [Acidobacteriota bacterium]